MPFSHQHFRQSIRRLSLSRSGQGERTGRSAREVEAQGNSPMPIRRLADMRATVEDVEDSQVDDMLIESVVSSSPIHTPQPSSTSGPTKLSSFDEHFGLGINVYDSIGNRTVYYPKLSPTSSADEDEDEMAENRNNDAGHAPPPPPPPHATVPRIPAVDNAKILSLEQLGTEIDGLIQELTLQQASHFVKKADQGTFQDPPEFEDDPSLYVAPLRIKKVKPSESEDKCKGKASTSTEIPTKKKKKIYTNLDLLSDDTRTINSVQALDTSDLSPIVRWATDFINARVVHQIRDTVVYFTPFERQEIGRLVEINYKPCAHGPECLTCLAIEYAFWENKAMPIIIPPEERQKVIALNRSLRNIKTEIDTLLERGEISDQQYEQVLELLPTEVALVGPVGGARYNDNRASVASASTSQATAVASAPSNAFQQMNLAPAASPVNVYQNPTPVPTGPTLVGRCTALYPFPPSNAPHNPGDCSFDRNDIIDIYAFENNEWCRGINQRTRADGLFPRAYVQIQSDFVPAPPNYAASNQQPGYYGNEKVNQQNPYDSNVPPQAVAEQNADGSSTGGKAAEYGKKFGKKLGNATIFGAGATLGGDIVNSIF